MKAVYVVLIAGAVVIVRVAIFRAQKRRRADGAAAGQAAGSPSLWLWHRALPTFKGDALGSVGLVAFREIRERLRGRLFRVGTLLILVIVAAAIIIPTLHGKSGPTVQRVGIVGHMKTSTHEVLTAAASQNSDSVHIVHLSSVEQAKAELRAGTIDVALVGTDEILLQLPASSSKSSADPGFVTTVASYLGTIRAYNAAGLTNAQAERVSRATPIPVHSLEPSPSNSTTAGSSVIGIVLLFIMLQQYNTWILIGVMQEKSSRVVEVLLAALRPIELLGGKVLGIGLVALGQATLIVGFALALGAGVGSDLLKGTAPLVLLSELLWLVLGYAFYCWVYAAAGSTAERQDQVQTLALPLSIPIIIAYIFSLTVVSSHNADIFFKILAFLPPTAPFCMSVLVAIGQTTWWQFLASVLITIASTAGMAVFAARIYQRAVLQTGGRVHLRTLFAGSARLSPARR